MRWIRASIGLNVSPWMAVFAALLLPSIATAQTPPRNPTGRFVVDLDAAHGGHYTGVRRPSGQLEKAATLALRVRLRSLLAARGMTVITTRESDMTVDPNARAQIANRSKADACLSLHATESRSEEHTS